MYYIKYYLIAEDSFSIRQRGFRGSESNDHTAESPLRAWEMVKEDMHRVRAREHDRILAENRKKYMK